MKRSFQLIALIAASLASIGSAWADTPLAPGWQEIAPYSETFANAKVTSSKFTTLADYWTVKGDGAVWTVSSGAIGTTQNLTANTTDYLITPQVKGAVTFKAKYCYWGARTYAEVKVYKCTLDEGVYTLGDAVISQSLEEVSSFTTITIAEAAEDYSYYAIHLSGAYFDDFSATSANVNVPVDKQFLPTGISSDWSDNNPLFANAEGNATWTGKIKVKNTGNVDLAVGEENFSLAVASSSTYSVTTTMTSFAIPENLAVGEEKEFDVEVPIALATANDGRSAIKFTTNLLPAGTTASTSANYKQSGWFTLKTQAPKLVVKNASNSDVTSYTTELGLMPAPASTTFTLKNDGGSPVVLKSIESSFVNATWKESDTTVVFPYQIAKGESKTFTLTLNNTGGQASALTFNYGNTYDESTYSVVSKEVSAVVSDPSLYLENFDSYLTVPTGWCQPGWVNQTGSNWSFSSSSSNTYATNSTQAYPGAYLISPMITFAEGQSLTVSAIPGSTYASYDCYIRVLYSADRHNWTTANIIATSATKTSVGDDADKLIEWGSISSTDISKAKAYVISGIPAGDWYIGFESGYSKIDYIFGGVQKELDHDLYLGALEAPAKATVNYPVAVSLSYSNMIDKAEGAYTVDIYDGTTKLTTINKESLAAYASDAVSYEFYPHATGTLNLQAKITVGETVYTTAVASIPVAAEVATADALVGERTSSIGAYAPFGLNYNNSKSEFIYKADMIGLENGTQIASISFPYYNTSKNIEAQVKIFVENTDDETLTAFTADTTQMTCVYANASYVFTMGGTSAEHALMTFEFKSPFTYTGKNLRFVCVSENGKTFNNYYFEYVSSTGSCWCKRLDSFSSYQTDAGFASNNLPVCYLGYSVETPTITGVVKNEGVAVVGKDVRFSCGNVYYEGTTDAEGQYSVTIMQPSRKYVVSAAAETGTLAYATDSLTFAVSTALNINFASATVPVAATLNASGYATYSSALDAEIQTAGVDAYKASVADDVITLTKLNGYIPAGTGVILYGKGLANAAVEMAAPAGTAADVTGNELNPTTTANFSLTAGVANAWALSGYQFKSYTGAQFAANRAYLVYVPSASGISEMHVVFAEEEQGNVTGIETVDATENAVRYDLNGRVSSQKGLQIKNGKVVLIK